MAGIALLVLGLASLLYAVYASALPLAMAAGVVVGGLAVLGFAALEAGGDASRA
jgi:hypothetical protein